MPNSKSAVENGAASSWCIACRGHLSFLGVKSGYTYAVCDSCKTAQLDPLPSQSDVEQAYANSQYATATHGQNDPDAIRKSSRPYYASLLEALREHGASGLIIDYGAGWGGLCELIIEGGFKCRGLELSQKMVEECRARRLPVEQATLESVVEEGSKAGAIVLCGVFEHLLDPGAFLNQAYEILEDGGLLISLQPIGNFARLLAWVCRIGNVRKELPSMFWVFDPPWHVALYSANGMKSIVEKCGFDLIAIRFAPQGRMKGLYGAAQLILGTINQIGWLFCKGAWPLMVSHIYVLKKRPTSLGSTRLPKIGAQQFPGPHTR